MGLGARAGDKAGGLPAGFKQRLALAAATLHAPRILLLDEPTSGVDVISRRTFWTLTRELAGQGVTVLVTTHHLDEAEHCDRLALIAAGRLLALGSPAELRGSVGGGLVEVAVDRPLAALRVARGIPGVRQVTPYGARLHLLVDGAMPAQTIAEALARAGHPVQSAVQVPLSMEDVFAAIVERTTTLAEAA